ncbi:cytosine deaminase, partial [Burkholderia cenocepacia]
MTTLLIRNVRTSANAALDILIEDDRIARVGPSLDAPAGCAIEDGGLALALPGLVEGHTHLDKTHWGMPWYRNQVGPRLVDRIENERHYRATSGHDAGTASLALARAFLAAGTTRIRTHVDVDTEAGLRHLHG